jgi:hypothetical protein
MPMIFDIPISDLDVVYLTYDEPMKEKFWLEIQDKLPWAVRVDGVKGSDAAHKAAADASTTERFILIDGDNMPDFSFFNQTLTLTERTEHAVFRWRARNHINGLSYGNGGLSCWTRSYIRNMRTHEATDGRDETTVEFCFDPLYLPMHNCYSVTYPNGSPLHAWRAGFREGVKMCLDRGRRIEIDEFKKMLTWGNIEVLNIWHSIGKDVENGIWAIYGARLGTYMCMLEPSWDYTEVQNFDALTNIFNRINARDYQEKRQHYMEISTQLKEKLGLPCIDMNEEQSAFWKKYYIKLQYNKGIMDQ